MGRRSPRIRGICHSFDNIVILDSELLRRPEGLSSFHPAVRFGPRQRVKDLCYLQHNGAPRDLVGMLIPIDFLLGGFTQRLVDVGRVSKLARLGRIVLGGGSSARG
jgi:hypothetical protein